MLVSDLVRLRAPAVKHHVRRLLIESGIPFEPVRPGHPWGPYLVEPSSLQEWWDQIRAVRELFDYAAIARTLVAAWLKGCDANESFGLNPARTQGDIISGSEGALVCRLPGRIEAWEAKRRAALAESPWRSYSAREGGEGADGRSFSST